MDDDLTTREDGGSDDPELDDLLSQLLMLISELGDRLIIEDEEDPDALVGTNALLHLYEDEGSPLPTHSLRVGPEVTDSGNVAIVATMTYMPSSVPVEED